MPEDEKDDSRYTAHGTAIQCATCGRVVWSDHVDENGICVLCPPQADPEPAELDQADDTPAEDAPAEDAPAIA